MKKMKLSFFISNDLLHASINFLSKKKTDISNLIDTTFSFYVSFRFDCLLKFEQKLTFIIWFLTLIPKMHFFFFGFLL